MTTTPDNAADYLVAAADTGAGADTLVSGGGAGVGDSHLSIQNGGGQLIASEVQTNVAGWTLSDSEGSDLALDVDGIHVQILTPGLYLIQTTLDFLSAHGATDSFWDVYSQLPDGTGSSSDVSALDFGANGVTFPITSLAAGMSHTIQRFTRTASIKLKACPVGASAPEAIDFAGMDIVRLA